MTKVRFHGPVAGFSGAMGEMVFADNEEKNRTVAYMKTHYAPSQAQVDHRKNFTEAAAWAKTAMKNSGMRQVYEALAKEKDISANAVALADYLKPPSIEPLDLSTYAGQAGDTIYFTAKDNVGVIFAVVDIRDAEGNQFENGAAVEIDANRGFWMYTATSTIPAGTNAMINVKVNDRPGNIAEVTEGKVL